MPDRCRSIHIPSWRFPCSTFGTLIDRLEKWIVETLDDDDELLLGRQRRSRAECQRSGRGDKQ